MADREEPIRGGEAFDRMVTACPSFLQATELDRYVSAFEDEDTPDVFVRTSALAHHVVSLLAANRVDEMPHLFDTVEELLADGTDETVELVELGLIEPLQNIVSHDDILVGADRVVPWLGPRARRIWDDHDELWREAGRRLHDGPRVDDGDYRNIVDPDLRRYFQAHKRRLDEGTLISASDIVHYQIQVANISPIAPAGVPRIPWPALVVGLVLALCFAIAIYR